MKIKKGQTVRLVIEGTVHQRGERLSIWGGNYGSTAIADLEGTPLFWTENEGIELTILSELPEPLGLGAVVYASTAFSPKRKYVRVDTSSGPLWMSDKTYCKWDVLIDPVILSEGYEHE